MKHFTTLTMVREVLYSHYLTPQGFGVTMVEGLAYAMDMRSLDEYIVLTKKERLVANLETEFYTLQECAVNFVFGGKYSFPWSRPLYESLTAAEFRALTELRKWVRNLQKMCENTSPRFWTRQSDFVYVNLNLGRCIVFVDSLYKV